MINNATMRWSLHPDADHETGWSQDEDFPCEFLTRDEAMNLVREMISFVAPFANLYERLDYQEKVRFLEAGGLRKGWEGVCIRSQTELLHHNNALIEISLEKDGAEYNYSFTILEAISNITYR